MNVSEELKKRLENRRNNNNKTSNGTKKQSTSTADVLKNRLGQRKAITEFGLDTLDTDLQTVAKTIDKAYNGWQTKETMQNTLSSVQSIYDRLGKYQEYQKQYGGADLSELRNSYKSVLDGWEDLSKQYGRYKNADEYKVAVKNAKKQVEEYEGMKTANLGTVKTEIADLEEILGTVKKHEGNINTLENMKSTWETRSYGAKTDVYSGKIENARSELDKYLKSVGYSSVDELNKALGEKKIYLNNAERVQKGLELTSVGDKTSKNYDKDYNKYVDIGMNIPTDEVGTSKRMKAVGKGRAFNTPKVNDDIREAALAGERRRNGETSENASSYYDKGAIFDLMTDSELKDFYYYVGKDSEDGGSRTSEYLDAIVESLNARRSEQIAKMVEEKPWGEFGFSIEAGLDQWASGVKANLSDKDYIPYSAIQQASGIVRENVEYDYGKFARTMYDLSVTGANQLPSILVSTGLAYATGGGSKVLDAISKGAGLATMGASARGNAYQEMINLGYDKDQATTYANLSAASEVGLQALLGGISKLGGTSAKVSKLVEGIDNGIARFAIQFPMSVASEATEEGLQEILNPLFQNIAAGYDTGAEIDWSEVAYSALLGGLMGGMFEGPGLAVNSVAEHYQNKGIGKTIKANERVGDLFDLANDPEIASAYDTYTRYANKGINADNVSDVQLGRLYGKVKADSVDTLNSKKSTSEQKSNALKRLAELSAVETENTIKKAAKEFNVGEETKVTESGDAVDIKGLNVKGDAVTVATDKGDISIDDMTLTQRDAEFVAMAKEISKSDGEDVANLFVSQYDGNTDIYEYANSFNLTMAYAKNNFTINEILNKKGTLSAEQVNAIYQETRIKADKEKAEYIKKLNKEMADKGFYKGFIDEAVIDYENTSAEGKINWKDLSARQQQAVTFIKGFAQATGMNLVFVANNSKYNGKYNRTTNTFTINLDEGGFDAINKLEETIIPTMSHETTHWMKEKSPELWRNLNEIVFSTLTEHYNSNTEQAIKDKIALLDKLDPRIKHTEEDAKERTITEEDLVRAEMNRKGKSEDESREEIIARACEDMLKMSEQGRKIFFSLSEAEQKTLADKIKSLINDLLNWVNELLNSYEATSTEARIMRDYKEQLQKASKVWDEMLKKSVEANQSLEKSGAYEHKKSTSESDVVYDEKDYSYWLDRIETVSDEKALEAKSKITYLRVSDTTPEILRKYGANDLPIIMRFDAMYLAQRGSGVLEGHYHDLGKEVMSNLMTYLSNPDVILQTVTEDGKTKLAVLISIPVKSGEALASVEINTLKDRGSGDELYNLVVTFFDFKENYLRNLFKKYGAEIKYKKETLSQDNPKLHKWLGTIKESVPKDSILDSDKDVKEKVSNNKADSYAKATEMQTEINQLTEEIRNLEKSDEFEAIMGVFKNDIEKGIAEYNKWLEESGYKEKKEKRDTLQNELNQLRKDLQESAKQEALDEEQKAIEKSGLSEADYFRKQAVKEFGYTPYFYDAGYITPNGKMLNFSGEKGMHYGSRGQDHRAIGIVYANVEGSKAMIKFMGEGNIRIMAESPGLDISSIVEPSKEQYATIRKFVREYANKEYFNIDLTDAEGHTIGNYEYEGKISVERVVNDIKYFFENGTTREKSSVLEFLSEKNIDKQTQVNTSMTMDEAKQMIQRAFVIGGIYEWYDREYKNGDEWLRGVGVDEVALNIENEYTLTEKYLNKLQGYIDGDFYVEDILEAYLNGTLVGKEKPKAKRLDTSKDYRINDERFYSPQRIKDAKKLLSVATQRMTDKNRKEVSDARAKVLIFAHNKGASELLGMTQAELNKKLRAWSNYSAKARDISKRFNNGVAESNKWTGIENCSWLYKGTVTTKDLESLVKSVKGASSDYEKMYIARTMLALDTHIDWSWLSFEFDTYNEVNKGKTFSVSKCLGYYTNDGRKIVVTHDKPHTVAHEMGHALDYQWARDLGFNYEALTEVSRHTERITDAETKQFFENFRIFIDSLTDNGDIRSEYTQNPKEVFARFVARFVQWVENTGTGRNSYNTETSYYNDKFTASHYIEFVKLLQEKAMLDAKKMETETNENTMYSEKVVHSLKDEINSLPAEDKEIVLEVRQRAIYSRSIATMSEDRLSQAYDDYSYSTPSTTDGYLAYIEPYDFIYLTTTNTEAFLENNPQRLNEGVSEQWGTENNIQKSGALYLSINEEGKVIGHEGRHRMAGLLREGVDRVAVVIKTGRVDNAKPISIKKLLGQDFRETKSYKSVYVHDMLPISKEYENINRHIFGDVTEGSSFVEPNIRYSEKEQGIYDRMGETERIRKENEKFKAEIERLNERLKIERKVTHGNYFNENQLGTVAGHLRNISNSNYDKVKLMKSLKDVYSFIAHSENLTWEEVFSKCYDIADAMLAEAKPEIIVDDYSKYLLREIRNSRISLDEEQKKEAQHHFGKNWNRQFMGKVIISNDGTNIDAKWQEWSHMYPEIFDAEVNSQDMIAELYDIIGSLKEASETIAEYGDEEQKRWLANEIYNQYWNVSPIRTTADKYDKQIKRLNYEHRNAMKEYRDAYEKRIAEQGLADDMYYGKKLAAQKEKHSKELAEQKQRQKEMHKKLYAEIRERKDKEIALAKQHGREMMDRYKENAERKTRIQSITANSLSLNEMLIKNSKDKHIPEIMKGPVTSLLQAIDFSSKRMLEKGEPTKNDISLSKSLSKVKDMMAKATNAHEELVELYGHGLDEDIEKMVDSVDNIMRTVGDNEFIINKMTLEDLQTLDKVVKTIRHAVNKLNKFHTVHHARGIANLSQESISYLDSLGKGKIYDGIRGRSAKLLNWGNALPYYVFKRFGEGGMKVYEALQDGWDKFAFNTKQILDYANETYTSKEVKEWSEKVKTFNIRIPTNGYEALDENYEPQYQEVQLTVPQIMSMYCLNKREQARGHLFQGGIRVADIKTKKGEIISQSEGVIFTEKDVQDIFDSLTERQKEVADKLQEFMNTVCADWGNDVSMARFGYKAFGEENYFPIQSDKNNLAVNDETEQVNSLFKLLNMSFTKSTVDKANNRIVISDIFDVFAQHTSDMAKYNALALPVLDSFKWYNFTEKQDIAEGTFKTSGVKQSIENAFGKDGQNYFTTFLKDINGQQEVSRDTLGKSFFTNAKIAAVGANLRVMLLQPTSYVRASAVIDNKYLTKALGHKPKIAKAETHCGIALWKSLGYYDTNIQRGLEAQIKHADTWKDKATEWSMKGAEIADKITWGYLWNACELEIRDTRKDLKVGSQEFYDAIAKRLREVIYATQVVDSTMTRSQIMRSSDGYDKMLTSFASEPTLSYNMLQDAYMQYKLDARQMGKKEARAKNAKQIGRILYAYTMTNAVAALVESAFDAFRDDDDEEMDMIEFLKLYFKNFAFDMSIGNKIPFVKELYSVLQGYSSSRLDTQWAQYLYSALNSKKPSKRIGFSIRLTSQLFGLPFYNVYRDTMAALNKLDLFTEDDLNEMFGDFED